MPPKVKVTKESIISAAVDMARIGGIDVINARSVAQALGVSTQPIFSNYSNMDELRADVLSYAERLYFEHTEREMSKNEYPAYKASGMAYIGFAKAEGQLFKLLFMRDRSDMKAVDESEKMGFVIDLVQSNLGVDRDTAKFFHLEMWVFVHGIATLCATGYLELDDEMASSMISDMYNGLKQKYVKEG